MKLSTLWEIPPSHLDLSWLKWCITTKLKTLSPSFLELKITKTLKLLKLPWTHLESFKDLRVLALLQVKILLVFSKTSLSICLLENISENSLIQSSHIWEPPKVTKKRKELTLMLSHRWSTTTLQATLKFSCRKSGWALSIETSWRTATEQPKNTWTSFWKLRVTGLHFKLFTTLSITKIWVTPRVKVSERNISIILVTFIQEELRN